MSFHKHTDTYMFLNCANKKLDLTHPQIMGILNVTPDSRYGSDHYGRLDSILFHAEQMVKNGAAIIDIGGESTRPGADSVSLQEELDRVMPVVTALQQRIDTIISVDTRKPEVMREAIVNGAHLINDVCALQAEGALEIIAKSSLAVCLMHMQGEPPTMQQNPHYENVLGDVKFFLNQRLQTCLAAGIASERIVIDPGFGFGKNLQHNLKLLKHLAEFQFLNVPILVGLSRKSMLENLLGLPVEERLPASLALAVLAVSQGAKIIRTHDVKPTVEAVKTAFAVTNI